MHFNHKVYILLIRALLIYGGGADFAVSRHKDTVDLGKTLKIEPLQEIDAIELLNLRASKTDENMEGSLETVKALGCLPLGVNQAAAYIHRTRLSYRNFLDQFYKRRQILSDSDLPKLWNYKKAAKGSPTESNVGIWTTWEMSMDLLKSGEFGALKEVFLTLAGFLNGRHISQEVFEPLFSIFVVPWKPDATDMFLNFIADASDLSLVENIIHDAKGASFSLHPLVTEWLWRRLSDDTLQMYIERAIFSISTFFLGSECRQSQDMAPLRYEILAHMQQCLRLLRNIELHAEIAFDDQRYINSIRSFAKFLDDCSLLADAENILLDLVSTLQSRTSHETELQFIQTHLGEICMKRHDLKRAEEYFFTVLDSNCALPTKLVVPALLNLCSIYLRQGFPKKATQLCLSVVQDCLPHFQVNQGFKLWSSVLRFIMQEFLVYLCKRSQIHSSYLHRTSMLTLIPELQDVVFLLIDLASQLSSLMNNISLRCFMKYHSRLGKILHNNIDEALSTFEECVHCLGLEDSTDIRPNEQQLRLYIVLGITAQIYMHRPNLPPSTEIYGKLGAVYKSLVPTDRQSSVSGSMDYFHAVPRLFAPFDLFEEKEYFNGVITIHDILNHSVYDILTSIQLIIKLSWACLRG